MIASRSQSQFNSIQFSLRVCRALTQCKTWLCRRLRPEGLRPLQGLERAFIWMRGEGGREGGRDTIRIQNAKYKALD